MRKTIFCPAAVVTLALASPAQAQLSVIDSANLARSIETARNTLETIRQMEQQVAEARRLYESVNSINDIQDVARILDDRSLRGALPEGMQSSAQYASTDLRDLGSIGGRAEEIYSASNARAGVSSASEALDVLGRRAARDQALGEYALERAELRGEGLGVLQDRLATATTQSERDEIAATANIETAAGINETNRLLAAREVREAAEEQARREAAVERAERRRRAAEGLYR